MQRDFAFTVTDSSYLLQTYAIKCRILSSLECVIKILQVFVILSTLLITYFLSLEVNLNHLYYYARAIVDDFH